MATSDHERAALWCNCIPTTHPQYEALVSGVARLIAAAREEGRRSGIEEAARFCRDAARVTVGEAARDAVAVLAETLPMLLDAPREGGK